MSRFSPKTGSLLETQDRIVSATKRATGRRITKAHTTKGQAHGDLNMTTVLSFVKGTVGSHTPVPSCSVSSILLTKQDLVLTPEHF